jgi:hypothetical protein
VLAAVLLAAALLTAGLPAAGLAPVGVSTAGLPTAGLATAALPMGGSATGGVSAQAVLSGCVVADRALAELSGLAVTGGQVWAMADGGRRVEVSRLDPATCAVLSRRDAGIDPYDPEDLASGPDGALWVGDIGDNERRRGTVAVIVLPAGGGARLHRLAYPDGPHDAEALLADGAGRPVIVTKEVGGAGIYRGPVLDGPGPFPLERVGTVVLPPSDTPGGPLGSFGSALVTGAARTGELVALRSYTDAWLYPMRGGDVVGALAGTPVRVPLPDEPQGEAIAFTADGTLLSGSETRGGEPGRLRAVPGAASLVTPAPGSGLPGSGAGPGSPVVEPGGAGPAAVTPEPWTPGRAAVVGGGITVALLAVFTLVAVRRARRR